MHFSNINHHNNNRTNNNPNNKKNNSSLQIILNIHSLFVHQKYCTSFYLICHKPK